MIYDLTQKRQTEVHPSTWPYDKYPDTPELKAGAVVTILDAHGPGVVTCIHASAFLLADRADQPEVFRDSIPYGARLILRVYYDGHTRPDVEMPYMDFLGDVAGESESFSTCWFSKVPISHNFRLPMPFCSHIRMTLENPTDRDLMGYTDIQLDRLSLPEKTGYLYTQYLAESRVIPGDPFCLFRTSGQGRIAAHWLRIQGRAPGFEKGEGLCEANCEFYADGEQEPFAVYQGVEDFYGFSWGFQQLHSDGQAAIFCRDSLDPGARIGILRCREADAISYQNGCRLMLDYTQEYFSPQSVNPIHRENPIFRNRPRYEAEVSFRSCFYYYA